MNGRRGSGRLDLLFTVMMSGALGPGCGNAAGTFDAAPTRDARPLADASAAATDGAAPDARIEPAGDAAAPDGTPVDGSVPDAGGPDAPGPDAASPRECYVPATHPAVQAAVSDPSCNPIHVDSGTYPEHVVVDRDVDILGPATTAAPAIVDGGGLGAGVSTSPGTVVVIERLTVQNGYAEAEDRGAGIHAEGRLWIRDTRVVSNTGNGVFLEGPSDSRITDSTIASNTGIGVFSRGWNGTLHVEGSDLTGNHRGIYADEVTLVVSDSTISANAERGILAWDALGTQSLEITDTVVDGNGFGIAAVGPRVVMTRTSVTNSSLGPGIGLDYAYDDVPLDAIITACTISGNRGGVRIDFSQYGLPVRIERSLIADNAAGSGGDGVFVAAPILGGGSVAIVNSTLTGNTRGVRVVKTSDSYGFPVSLSNTTITDNHAATGVGAGLYAIGELPWTPGPSLGAQTVHVHNSIIAGNTASGIPDDCATVDDAHVETNGFNVLGTVGGCVITGPASDTVDADPLLGPLSDNGGPTLTHALLPDSPALDAGDPAGCSDPDGALLLVDQRGQPRPSGAACDSGAYEAGP